jgi:hypothetical protein
LLQPKPGGVFEWSRKIYQTLDGKNFNTDIELQICIHCYLSRGNKQLVSLLLFRVQFACLRKHSSFNRTHLRVDFEDSRGIEPTASPVIISHAPFELRRQSITEIDV